MKKGAKVDIQNLALQTPLHIAIGLKHMEIIQFLLPYPKNINSKDFQTNTMLHLACNQNMENIAIKLFQLGADPNLTNFQRNTPFHIAMTHDVSRLTRFFLQNTNITRKQNMIGNNIFEEGLLHNKLINVKIYLNVIHWID